MEVVDQIGRKITINEPPHRIVSLVPSITELICDLGLEENLVGVTKFCVHPNHLRETTSVVGGTKNVSAKKVKDLQPDLILANKEENTEDTVKKLSGFTPVHVSDVKHIEDCIDLIYRYGKIFNIQTRAEELISQINLKKEDFRNFIKNKDPMRVAYIIWRDPWMTVGSGTFINSILKLNNLENAFAHLERYPVVKIEDLKNSDLDLVLLSSEPYPFKQKHITEVKKELPESNVILVDGEMFSWYGSRIIKAFDYFKVLNAKIR